MPDNHQAALQLMNDDLWNGNNDTEEFKKLRLLTGHKPSIIGFINYTAGLAEKEKKAGIFSQEEKEVI